jgi:hypothetical protein
MRLPETFVTNSVFESRGSAVGIATGYGLEAGIRISGPGRVKIFLLSTSSRLVLGPIRLPVETIPVFSPG